MSAALDIARTILAGFDKHYRLFRESGARAKYLFVRGAVGRHARGLGPAHPDVRQPGGRGGRGPARALPRSPVGRVALARGQARVHRPAARAPPARVRRDVLQLGGLPRARPALLPQRVHLPARGACPPSTSTARSRPTAATTPPRRGLRSTIRDVLTSFGLASPFEDLDRDVRCIVRALRERFPGRFRIHDNFQVQVLSSLFFREQGGVRRGQGGQRHRRAPVRGAAPAQR